MEWRYLSAVNNLYDILWKCILGQDKVSHTRLIVPLSKFLSYAPLKNVNKILVCTITRFKYLHETLLECVSGQDDMSHITDVTFRFSVSEFWPFGYC